MNYKVPNPLPLAARLRAIAREEGARAALGRVATYGRLRLAESSMGKAVGFGNGQRSAFALGSTWAQLAAAGVFHGAAAPGRAPHLAIIAETSLPQCTKYRVAQMAGLARQLGAGVSIADQRDEDEAITALQMASHVMFYRLEPSPRAWMYLYEARRLGLPVLYDLDDPLFSVPAITGALTHLPDALVRHFADAAPGFLAIMAACDAVSVSTAPLAEAVRAFLPRPVFLRRNHADEEALAPLGDRDVPVAGGPGLTLALASGSEGRSGDLEPLVPVLDRFLEADPARRLILIGHGLENHAGLSPKLAGQISLAPFQDYPLYKAQLAQADAVLVPLQDDPFNACKSAVRALDAAAVARPVIASPVGDLPELVAPGATGWLAQAPQDWAAALEALAALPDRGRAMGNAARAALERDWSDPTDPRLSDPGLSAWLAR